MVFRGKVIKKRFWFLLFAPFIIGILISMRFTESAIAEQKETLAKLGSEIEEITQKNDDLRRKIAFVDTDPYIEQTAREELKLIKDDEIRYLLWTGDGPPPSSVTADELEEEESSEENEEDTPEEEQDNPEE